MTKRLLSLTLLAVACFAQTTGAPWADTSPNIGASNLFNPLNAKINFQIVADLTALAAANGTSGKDFAFVQSDSSIRACVTSGTPCGSWQKVEFAMTFSTGLSRSGQGVTCLTASGSQLGCLSAADWTAFNSKISNPLTTAGDIFIGGASGTPTRLAAGAVDTALHGNGTGVAPSFVALLNCGDPTHALGYNTSTHTYTCQAITGSAAAGGSNGQVQINNSGALGGITLPTSGILKGSAGPTFAQAVFGDVVSLFGSGSCIGFLKNDGTCSTPGGVSGLTLNRIPKAASSTTLADGPLSVDATTNQVSGSATINGPAPAAGAFSATPTIDLATCARCEMPTLTANVTSVTFTHAKAGLKFSVVWPQDATGGRTVVYGGSANNACAVIGNANSTTVQDFEVASDGTTIVGKGCSSNVAGLLVSGQTGTPCASNPASGSLCAWLDAAGVILVKDSSGNVYAIVKTAASGTTNQWIDYVAVTGIPHTSQPACGSLSNAAASCSTDTTNAANISSGTLAKARGGAGADMTNVTFPSSGTLAITVANGTATLGTSAISANSCATVVTVTATGVTTTDTIAWTPNADISGVTGYSFTSTDGLKIYPYPTAGAVNFKVCNGTGSPITPGTVVINWRVGR